MHREKLLVRAFLSDALAVTKFCVAATTPTPKNLAPIFSTPVKRRASQDPGPSPSVPESSSRASTSSFSHSAKRSKTLKTHAVSTSETLTSVAPLADRMRPQTLDDFAGHDDVIGKGTLLRGLIDSGAAGSLLLVSIRCSMMLRLEPAHHLTSFSVGSTGIRQVRQANTCRLH